MKQSINIQEVISKVRYEVLDLQHPTPQDFDEMSWDEQTQLYREMFDRWHKACNILSSLNDIMGFMPDE